MDEVGKIARYSLPGIASIFLFGMAIFITDSKGFSEAIDLPKGTSAAIVVLLATFVATGGLGFLLSILYRPLSRTWKFQTWAYSDYSSLWNHLLLGEISIKGLRDKREDDSTTKSVSNPQAYLLTVQYWFSRIEGSDDAKGICSRVKQLADLKQGIGTTLFGSAIAFAFWLGLHFCIFCNGSIWSILPVLGWLAILVVFCFSFREVKRDLEIIVESAILADVRDRDQNGEKNGEKTIWFTG